MNNCNWYQQYVGLEYRQYNCGALLKKVWKEQLNINIDISSSFDLENEVNNRQDFLLNKASNLKIINEPKDKCGVLMYSRSGIVGHVGIYVDIFGGYILHAHKNFTSSVLQSKGTVFTENKLYNYYIPLSE